MNCMSLVRVPVLLGCASLLCLCEDQPVVIRSNVHMVEVSVIATGAKGSPVDGLSASDFRIFDNGRPQTIATFEELDSRAAPSQTELPPNTYSNRLPGTGGLGKTTRPQVLSIVYLDNANTKARFQTVGRRAVASILEQLDPAECVAIYAFGDHFQVIHDFSSDRESLLARLKAYQGETPGRDDLLQDLDLDIAEELRGPPPPLQKAMADTARAVDTFEALEAIATYVKGVPGRKNLLWVSEAFPMEVGNPSRRIAPSATNPVTYVPYRNFGPEMKRAMAALNDANVSVYPIYARGLSKCCYGPAADPIFEANSTMRNIAGETGGKAYVNRNDLARGVRLALDDSRHVYLMTYYPEAFVEDGAYHRIGVRTTRPGVQLRFRQGYFARENEEDGGAGAENRLARALSSPLDASEIGLRASVEPAGAGDLAVAVNVDPADLALARVTERWTGALLVLVVQTGGAGERYEPVRQTLQLNLSPESYRSALERGLRFTMKLKREPAAIAVRIAVSDEQGARVGSLSVPLPNSAGTGARSAASAR